MVLSNLILWGCHMGTANERQVGGSHYKRPGIVEHWDIVAQHQLDYFQGQITKYVMRWRDKGGLQDLEKAQHFLEKYIELAKAEGASLFERYAPDLEAGPTGPSKGGSKRRR